jgi:hypothetical protein
MGAFGKGSSFRNAYDLSATDLPVPAQQPYQPRSKQEGEKERGEITNRNDLSEIHGPPGSGVRHDISHLKGYCILLDKMILRQSKS